MRKKNRRESLAGGFYIDVRAHFARGSAGVHSIATAPEAELAVTQVALPHVNVAAPGKDRPVIVRASLEDVINPGLAADGLAEAVQYPFREIPVHIVDSFTAPAIGIEAAGFNTFRIDIACSRVVLVTETPDAFHLPRPAGPFPLDLCTQPFAFFPAKLRGLLVIRPGHGISSRAVGILEPVYAESPVFDTAPGHFILEPRRVATPYRKLAQPRQVIELFPGGACKKSSCRDICHVNVTLRSRIHCPMHNRKHYCADAKTNDKMNGLLHGNSSKKHMKPTGVPGSTRPAASYIDNNYLQIHHSLQPGTGTRVNGKILKTEDFRMIYGRFRARIPVCGMVMDC